MDKIVVKAPFMSALQDAVHPPNTQVIFYIDGKEFSVSRASMNDMAGICIEIQNIGEVEGHRSITIY